MLDEIEAHSVRALQTMPVGGAERCS